MEKGYLEDETVFLSSLKGRTHRMILCAILGPTLVLCGVGAFLHAAGGFVAGVCLIVGIILALCPVFMYRRIVEEQGMRNQQRMLTWLQKY